MSEELKPCPFCGSVADHWFEFDVPRAGCSNDNCIAKFDDFGVSVKDWNTRHTAETEEAAVKKFCDWMPKDYESAEFQEGVNHIREIGRSYANNLRQYANKMKENNHE